MHPVTLHSVTLLMVVFSVRKLPCHIRMVSGDRRLGQSTVLLVSHEVLIGIVQLLKVGVRIFDPMMEAPLWTNSFSSNPALDELAPVGIDTRTRLAPRLRGVGPESFRQCSSTWHNLGSSVISSVSVDHMVPVPPRT